jgi:hypothetical protein
MIVAVIVDVVAIVAVVGAVVAVGDSVVLRYIYRKAMRSIECRMERCLSDNGLATERLTARGCNVSFNATGV